jgi:hypothetical protein
MAQLEFRYLHRYGSSVEGITVPAVLRSGVEVVDLLARIDTGASNCLFQRELGEMLKLEIETGEPKTFSTATGSVAAFGHFVSLSVLDIEFESMVYFFADERINKNLLGRAGWLDRVRFGLIDHDQELYLAPYDFAPA